MVGSVYDLDRHLRHAATHEETIMADATPQNTAMTHIAGVVADTARLFSLPEIIA